MKLEVDFFDEESSVKQEELAQIEELLNFAGEKEGVQSGSELSVTFVSNERIQEINREYRDKDHPTDVISFAMEELGEGELEILGAEIPRILGDIIISIPKAREQAAEYNHSFMRELGFLAVHGFLHLLGYDHLTADEEKVMVKKQKEILEGFGLERQ